MSISILIKTTAQKYAPLIAQIREQIHQNPETGFELTQTAALVVEHLNKLNLIIRQKVNKSGVVADLITPNATKTIALRADMDALEMQEQNHNCTYASKVTNKAHMCGHDGHTAMLIGAAYVLNELRDKLKVNVRFIFQPSEEQFPGGAIGMIEEGVLDGVDEIYGMHVAPFFNEGIIGVWNDYAMAGVGEFNVKFIGQGGHASMPHLSINPHHMAASFVLQSEHIIASNTNTFDQAVVTTTMVHGGSAHNIIPNQVEITGSVRYLKDEIAAHIVKRLEQIAAGVAQSYGGSYAFNYQSGYPATLNNPALAAKAQSQITELFGNDKLLILEKPLMGSEDFSYYARKIPGCFVGFGTINLEKGYTSGIHQTTFDLDSSILWQGSALHAMFALS